MVGVAKDGNALCDFEVREAAVDGVKGFAQHGEEGAAGGFFAADGVDNC